MGQANRSPKDAPTKEPAEDSRGTVDEALQRPAGRKPAPRPDEKPQEDVPPGRHALDD